MSTPPGLAGAFDAMALNGAAERHEEAFGDIARQVIEGMAIRAGQHVLEVGCGVGWATRRLGRKAPGSQATGVDISPEMIKRAEEMSDWSSRTRFQRMDFAALEFPDARFDHAFALGAYEFATDLGEALRELARVIKPGGRAEVIVRRFAESPATEGWPASLGVPMQWLDSAAWAAALSEAGFEATSSQYVQDSRGQDGGQAEFEPSTWVASEQQRDALFASGALWLRGKRP